VQLNDKNKEKESLEEMEEEGQEEKEINGNHKNGKSIQKDVRLGSLKNKIFLSLIVYSGGGEEVG